MLASLASSLLSLLRGLDLSDICSLRSEMLVRENRVKMLVESLANDVANCAFEIIDLSLTEHDKHDVSRRA